VLGERRLRFVAIALGKTIVEHGFDKHGRLLKAIQWNGQGKPLGPMTASARGTNYSEWALTALAVTARLAAENILPALAAAAVNQAKTILDGNTYDNLPSYMAAGSIA